MQALLRRFGRVIGLRQPLFELGQCAFLECQCFPAFGERARHVTQFPIEANEFARFGQFHLVPLLLETGVPGRQLRQHPVCMCTARTLHFKLLFRLRQIFLRFFRTLAYPAIRFLGCRQVLLRSRQRRGQFFALDSSLLQLVTVLRQVGLTGIETLAQFFLLRSNGCQSLL